MARDDADLRDFSSHLARRPEKPQNFLLMLLEWHAACQLFLETITTSKEKVAMKKEQMHELLCQALETEMGGIQIYQTALRCAVNEDLKEEWEKYLEQTQTHEQTLRGVFEKLSLDPNLETDGRKVVKHIGESLVKAMKMALDAGKPEAAQLVAAECIVLAETKDHLNWELIGQLAKDTKGETAKALSEAFEQIEDEEDEHLYHTSGWTRELWISSLGLPAVIPPPEEEKDVKTAIGAARAKNARTNML
jgi:rubrerythrin